MFVFVFFACFFAAIIFCFTKSIPVIFAPKRAKGSQTNPPPHPKSKILKLLRQQQKLF